MNILFNPLLDRIRRFLKFPLGSQFQRSFQRSARIAVSHGETEKRLSMKRNNDELSSPFLAEILEERLRPNRFLGYDRDNLGVALLRREMFEAAESQFRRAIYLNLFKSAFVQHLAWCLHRQGREEEALVAINQALTMKPKDTDARAARERILESKEKISSGMTHHTA